MTIKFFLEMTDEQKDSLDTQIYECDMDDEFWWEDQDTTIVTENSFFANDMEQLLKELDIPFTIDQED